MIQQIFDRLPFRARRNSANVARERLQIIVAHQGSSHMHTSSHLMNDLRQEILEVIRKYVNIDKDQVQVSLDRTGSQSILELNVVLPDEH